jgi:hypothetical protein
VVSRIQKSLADLRSKDDRIRFGALQTALKATDKSVDWVYDVWDDLIKLLADENSYQRSIAAMLLCNLAKSDSAGRLDKSLTQLLQLTTDEKFVTSRQTIQNIWKVAVASNALTRKVVAHLKAQYESCKNDKHYNLLRMDILQSLRNVYDYNRNDSLRNDAMKLIEKETEPKVSQEV